MTQTNLEKVTEVSSLYKSPTVVLESKIEDTPPIAPVHSYHPTHWPIANRALDIVDSVTRGRAGQIQKFISFAFLGGLATLVNLGVYYVVYYDGNTLINNVEARYIIASLLAAEISIIANFSLNDYFTFRHMPGRVRSWKARCARFHMTSISGTILTFLINLGLTHGIVHLAPVRAQAIAIFIVLFYNFAAHHFFTYRHVKPIVAN